MVALCPVVYALASSVFACTLLILLCRTPRESLTQIIPMPSVPRHRDGTERSDPVIKAGTFVTP